MDPLKYYKRFLYLQAIKEDLLKYKNAGSYTATTFGNTNLRFKPDKVDVYEDNFSKREMYTKLSCPAELSRLLLSIFLLFYGAALSCGSKEK